MLKDKKGISAIVMTIIMVGLVLVAVGIVWAVVLNILEGQEEQLAVSEKCLGIVIEPTNMVCGDGKCNVTLERATGSSGDTIDGVEVTVNNGADTNSSISGGDIAVTKTVSVTDTLPTATEASVRIYFDDAEGNPQYCSQIASYP